MKVIEARNVHEAFPIAMRLLWENGYSRPSRNGDVYQVPFPVTTVYQRPYERVLFWPERDANPFFHLFESLWMLAGRNDVAPVSRFAKQMLEYSDDGETLRGAYGHRWRFSFDPVDQLEVIVDLLRDKNNRRAVLQMWDATFDLGAESKDLPCNLVATFQVSMDGRLDLVVFCRSNDIIWGAYGANAVHFSVLLEYMSIWTGYPMGTYSQVSVNWHAYANVIRKRNYSTMGPVVNPYGSIAHYSAMSFETGPDAVKEMDGEIQRLLASEAVGFDIKEPTEFYTQFWANAYHMAKAYTLYKANDGKDRFIQSLEQLSKAAQTSDWIIVGREWIERRKARWEDSL